MLGFPGSGVVDQMCNKYNENQNYGSLDLRQYVDLEKSDERHIFDTVFLYIRFATEIVGFRVSLFYRRNFFEAELSSSNLGVYSHRL